MNKYAWRGQYNNDKSCSILELMSPIEAETEFEKMMRRDGRGLALIERMIKEVKSSPKGKDKDIADAIKQVNSNIKTVKAQLDILSNPKSKINREEYTAKTSYSIVNLMNIINYLYNLSVEEDELWGYVLDYMRGGPSAYDLARTIKEFNDDKKAFVGRR